MKTAKTFLLLFILLYTSVFFVNVSAAEIRIIDADAIFERKLESVDIPTQAIPVTKLFINNADAILTKSLLSVGVPTQTIPVSKLFISNADAILSKGLVPLGSEPQILPPSISSFTLSLDKGLNMVSLPLKPQVALTARSLAEKLGSTVVIRYDTKQGEFLPFVPEVSKVDGFPIEGGMGYIVNLLGSREVVFSGTAWSDAPPKLASGAPSKEDSNWAFVVCGAVYDGDRIAENPNLIVTIKNLRNRGVIEAQVGKLENGRYTSAFVDLNRKNVIKPGDILEIHFRDTAKRIESEAVTHKATASDIAKSYVEINLRMKDLAPEKTILLQNYPNPFNPETWIPYQLQDNADVVISIYTVTGQPIRILNLGHKLAGFYIGKENSAYWDGKNEAREQVASGVYFYSIKAGDFTATRKMVITR